MKKKGFTLVELLAVIIILAIIVVIVSPKVATTINNSKRKGAERSAENYIKAVEYAISTRRLNGEPIPDGTYTIDSNGNLGGVNYIDKDLCSDQPNEQNCEIGTEQKIAVKAGGSRPTSGKITIKKGKIIESEVFLNINDYKITLKDGNGTILELENKLCVNTFGEPLTIGSEYVCELGDGEIRTFYVLENGDTTTLADNKIANTGEVSLIMNSNIGTDGKAVTLESTVSGATAWCTVSDWSKAGGVVTNEMANDKGACQYGKLCLTNELGPLTANEELSKRTSGWKKITNKEKITLPNVYQIAQASGLVFNNSSTNPVLPSWLYGNINIETLGIHGYWTSTPKDDMNAWAVYKLSDNHAAIYHVQFSTGITISDYYGIRPVITISKSYLG